MPTPDFEMPKDALTDGARLYAACKRIALGGRATKLAFGISEKLNIVSELGEQPGFVECDMDVKVSIPVRPCRPDDFVTVSGYPAETEEFSAANPIRTRYVVNLGLSVMTPTNLDTVADPVAFLTKTAAQRATAVLEASLVDFETYTVHKSLEKELREHFGWAIAPIERELEALQVFVDDYGDSFLCLKELRPPRVVLAASPISGPKGYFNLLSVSDATPTGWATDMLSFPIGDLRGADAIRSELVATYCPLFDPEYGNDWPDTTLKNGHDDRIDFHEGLAHLDSKAFLMRSGIVGFATALDAHGFISGETLKRTKALPASVDDFRQVIDALSAEIADVTESAAYADFLEESGWTMPFEPLRMASLKLDEILGLPLDAGLPAVTSENSPSAPAIR